MIIVKCRKHAVPYRTVWFDPNPQFLIWPPRVYMQSPSREARMGLRREPFFTLWSRLGDGPGASLAAMNATSRNEVRQAQRAGVAGGEATAGEFVSFYNDFAELKRIATIIEANLTAYGASLMVTSARLGDRVLAMHALLLDPDSGRARLLHSASSRFTDSGDRALIGKSNRWLHWWEMQAAEQKGLRFYDWGGFAVGTTDPNMVGINGFKAAFGGQLVEESNYYPRLPAG